MNIPAVLIANGAAAVLLVTLFFSSRKTVRDNLLDSKIFSVMIFSAFFQCVVESATFLIDGRANLNALSMLLNSLLYVNNIFFAFLWTVYADYKLFSDDKRLRKRSRFIGIPVILIWIGVVVNLFTPVFFVINPENVYSRTSLYFVPFLLTYLYLAYGVFLVYFYRDKVHKYLFLPAIVFMIPILIGSILQTLFYGCSLTWLGTAIALTSLYINVQNEVSYVDSMTGLFTRQYLVQYLNLQFKNLGPDGKLVGIMLDIDRFKEINDTYGHLVGDEAIGAAGKLLRSSIPEKSMAARYAGDEFVIIQLAGDAETATQSIQQIHKNSEELNQSGKNPYVICFSVGYSEYCGGDTVDSFLGRLDAAMYMDKRRKLGTRRRLTDY